MDKPYGIEQRDKKALTAGYSPNIRRFEITSIIAFTLSILWLGSKIAPGVVARPVLALAMFFVGALGADFLTGMFHWAADTWGTVEWPIVGVGLIRPFREHHIDQLEITRHDFIETNGASAFITFFFIIAAAQLPQGPGLTWQFCVGAATLSTMILGFFTNQFHKWSHESRPPALVAALQRWHVILPVGHHQVHHVAPYTKYYCITNGWLNEPLHQIGYFRVMERVISAVTGLVPREDDLGKKAATALVDDALKSAEAAATSTSSAPSQSGR